jgi:hypothetical protein
VLLTKSCVARLALVWPGLVSDYHSRGVEWSGVMQFDVTQFNAKK